MTPRIDVFDPALCCSTGVCGPSVDPALSAFAADAQWLASQGVQVVRHNLAQEPQAFASNLVVRDLLSSEGERCLPVVLVDGDVLGHGAYPRREVLAQACGLRAAASTAKPRVRLRMATGGDCAPGSGCC